MYVLGWGLEVGHLPGMRKSWVLPSKLKQIQISHPWYLETRMRKTLLSFWNANQNYQDTVTKPGGEAGSFNLAQEVLNTGDSRFSSSACTREAALDKTSNGVSIPG